MGIASPLLLLLMVILSAFLASVVFEVGVGSEPPLRSSNMTSSFLVVKYKFLF